MATAAAKAPVVNGGAVRVEPGGRAGAVQGQPELRLFVTLIMELGRDSARAQSFQQGFPHIFGELAGVNRDGDGVRHICHKG
jgi:hypothetical protein